MEPLHEGAGAPPAAEASERTTVQNAVEQFIERHGLGEAEDPVTFVKHFPAELAPQILAQIQQFLAFDGLLGHQEWQADLPKQTSTTDGHRRVFGDFVIQEELGRGGMGIVYLAHQRSLNRRVALKVMASGLMLSKRHVERFRREAAAAARLRHPAIVPVHSLSEIDGTFALAMDYVAGRNLADILDDLRLQNGGAGHAVEGTLGLAPEKGYVAECAMFAAELASALAAAHQAGVVHRDLKPRNLMLDDRRQVRLLDFGLAKSLGEGSISMSGEITGTAHYLSPEQTLAKRVEVDHRADIWALGVILYELLTLRRPFDGKNLQQIVYEICFKEPPPIGRSNPKVPRDLVTICSKALEKDPQNRYATAAEFEADLQRFLRWEPIHAQPAGPMTRLAKWTRRHRTETAIAAVLSFGGLLLLGLGWQRGREADALLQRAEQVAEQGRFDEASALAEQALGLRNDAATRERLRRYGEAGRALEAETAWQVSRSRELIEHDRELAILVALGADGRHSTAGTRSAVLAALGSGQVVRSLRSTDDAPCADGLRTLRCSPDGRTVVVAGYDDGALRTFDVPTGQLRHVLRGHRPKAPVVALAFAGPTLWSAGTDKTLRSFRIDDGAPLATVELPGAAAHLSLDRSGHRALVVTVASERGPYHEQVFDLEQKLAIGPAIEHQQVVVAVALSPDGRFVASCRGPLASLQLRAVDDGRTIALPAPSEPRDRVRALAFAPDSSLLAIAVDQQVLLHHTGDGRLLGRVSHSREVTALAFDDAGERLLTGSRDATARVWSLVSHDGTLQLREDATLVGHGGPVDRVAFDTSGQLALTGTGNQAGVLRVFDVARGRTQTGTAVQQVEVGPSIEAAAFTPDARAVVALAGRSRAMVWDLTGSHGVLTLRQPGEVPALLFVGGSEQLVTAGDDRLLRAWSCRDGRQLWTTEPFARPLQRLAADPRGERLACSTTDGQVQLVASADGRLLGPALPIGGPVQALQFADESALLVVATVDGRGVVRRCPLDGGAIVTLASADQPFAVGAFAANGAQVATAGRSGGEVQILDLTASPGVGAVRARFASGQARIASLQFAPDGGSLLVASRDGSARQHRLDGSVLATFDAGHALQVARFGPDGSLVVTGGKEARTFAADGRDGFYFRSHRAAVLDLAVAPDGRFVASCASDGTTCLWPTDPVAACRRLSFRTPTDAERQAYGLPSAASAGH
ncbi:MAG: protein kinase [Planctomycetes bacterium]|nr:protein kinase [Planctomycetota bacterium]